MGFYSLRSIAHGCQTISLAILGGIALSPTPSLAQGDLEICQPPDAEVLVVVSTASPSAQTALRRFHSETRPEASTPIVCRYGNNVISRVAGFSDRPQAAQWGEALNQQLGFPLLVVVGSLPVLDPNVPTPETGITSVAVPQENISTVFQESAVQSQQSASMPGSEVSSAPTEPPTIPFQARSLQDGFGILVDYGGDPAIAPRLKNIVNDDLSLVVYDGRGYLLAAQTASPDLITSLLTRLNSSGFRAIAVPADQLILLKERLDP